jgi:peptidyl-prolyl cis-trans isomerase SurA
MQVIKKLLIASVLFALTPALAATPDTQRDVEGIAAIVNDKVISLFDVDQRVDLFFATSGIERSPQMRERIRSQVLRLLVDEELQMQEAERVEIKVEEEEIDNNIRRLAGESQMTIEGIREFLNGKGIEDDTLKRQIETELAWSQFVRRSFGGRLKIGEQEIEEQYKKAMRSLSEPRFKVSEILMNIESFANEDEINALSNEIATQLKNGVDFGAVARQFSISPSSARGGDIGWVTADQMDEQLARVVVQLEPGQISSPIRTTAGVYIIALAQRREGNAGDPMKNQFDILSVNFDTSISADTVVNYLADFKTCRRAQDAAKEMNAEIRRSGLRELREFPPALHNMLQNLEAGQSTQPQSTPEGSVAFIVCDRKDDQGTQVSRDTIADNIYSQRIAMMARRHLRDLRREAVVEYR